MELEKIIKEKCSLKEFEIIAVIRSYKQDDFLFITPNGYLIGKLYLEEEPMISSFLKLTDVVHINGGITNSFNNFIFDLAVNQIIAVSPIDREAFFAQIKSSQG